MPNFARFYQGFRHSNIFIYLLHFMPYHCISWHIISLCSSKIVVKLVGSDYSGFCPKGGSFLQNLLSGGSSLKSDPTRFGLYHRNWLFSIIKAADRNELIDCLHLIHNKLKPESLLCLHIGIYISLIKGSIYSWIKSTLSNIVGLK